MEKEKKYKTIEEKRIPRVYRRHRFSKHPCQNNNKIICVHKYKI